MTFEKKMHHALELAEGRIALLLTFYPENPVIIRDVLDQVREALAVYSASATEIEDPIVVPRGLLGAASAAIKRKHDAPGTLKLLRWYCFRRPEDQPDREKELSSGLNALTTAADDEDQLQALKRDNQYMRDLLSEMGIAHDYSEQRPSLSESLDLCPFCGGHAEIRKSGKSQYYVACEDCDSSSQLVAAVKENVEQVLIEAWNSRMATRRKIKRYKIFHNETNKPTLVESDDGPICLYEDLSK